MLRAVNACCAETTPPILIRLAYSSDVAAMRVCPTVDNGNVHRLEPRQKRTAKAPTIQTTQQKSANPRLKPINSPFIGLEMAKILPMAVT